MTVTYLVSIKWPDTDLCWIEKTTGSATGRELYYVAPDDLDAHHYASPDDVDVEAILALDGIAEDTVVSIVKRTVTEEIEKVLT